MTDDEIAERIAMRILGRDVAWLTADMTRFLDDAEAYRLAFLDDVRERAEARRQAARVRRIVFARLGLADRAAGGK